MQAKCEKKFAIVLVKDKNDNKRECRKKAEVRTTKPIVKKKKNYFSQALLFLIPQAYSLHLSTRHK